MCKLSWFLFLYINDWIPKSLNLFGSALSSVWYIISTNNDTTSLQPFISYLCVRQKIICKQCGMIGHKDDSCIFCGPNFLSPSLRINRNKSNALYGDEPAEPPREWNSQPPLVPRLERAVTWPLPAPVAWGHHGPSKTATCPV